MFSEGYNFAKMLDTKLAYGSPNGKFKSHKGANNCY